MDSAITAFGAVGVFGGLSFVFVMLWRYIGHLTQDRDYWRGMTMQLLDVADANTVVVDRMAKRTRKDDERIASVEQGIEVLLREFGVKGNP